MPSKLSKCLFISLWTRNGAILSNAHDPEGGTQLKVDDAGPISEDQQQMGSPQRKLLFGALGSTANTRTLVPTLRKDACFDHVNAIAVDQAHPLVTSGFFLLFFTAIFLYIVINAFLHLVRYSLVLVLGQCEHHSIWPPKERTN